MVPVCFQLAIVETFTIVKMIVRALLFVTVCPLWPWHWILVLFWNFQAILVHIHNYQLTISVTILTKLPEWCPPLWCFINNAIFAIINAFRAKAIATADMNFFLIIRPSSMARAIAVGNVTSNVYESMKLANEFMAKSKRRLPRSDSSAGRESIISFSEIALALRAEMVEILCTKKT